MNIELSEDWRPDALYLAREDDFTIGPMIVSPSASEIELAGEAHKLEPRVMQVLVALAHASGAVVSRSDLIDVCWGGVIVGDDAINRVIGRVRRLAELSDPPAFRIETIPKIGYRLIETASSQPPAPAEGATAPPVAAAVMPRPIRRNRFVVAALVLGLAGGAAVAAWFIPSLLPPAREGQGENVVIVAAPRLAVMPFDVEGAREDQGYLAEGIAEEIHDRLTKFENLEVVGLSSAVALSDVTDDVQELGRRLGASFLLQGGLKRDGESVRLDMRLIASRDGEEIWADRFEGAIKDVSTIEGEIARAIARALDVAFPASAAASNISAENPSAYELYLRGLAAYRKDEMDGEGGAIALLARAVEIDPALNEARARLAHAYAAMAYCESMAGRSATAVRTRKIANETALTELANDPDNPIALSALASVRYQEKRHNEAHALLERARRAAPEDETPVVVLSHLLAHAGYLEESRKILFDALKIHPTEPRILTFLADRERILGDYESAVAHVKVAYALGLDYPRWVYLVSLAAVGRTDEAKETIAAEFAATAPSDMRDLQENYWRSTLEAFDGAAGRARYIAAIRAGFDRRDPELTDELAPRILNLLGETELRDRIYVHLIDTGYFDRDPLAVMDLWAPWASNVRATPQFKELVVRMRFVPYWKKRGWPKGCWPTGADDFECG